MNAENQSQLHTLSAGGRQPQGPSEPLQKRILRQNGPSDHEKVITFCDPLYAGEEGFRWIRKHHPPEHCRTRFNLQRVASGSTAKRGETQNFRH